MLESLLHRLGTFCMSYTGFVVAMILAAKWLVSRRKPAPVVAGMEHKQTETAVFDDTVAALRSLGVNRAVAKKRVEEVMRAHPDVSDPKELLKLCYQRG